MMTARVDAQARTHAALASPTRRRLLEVLDEERAPQPIAALASALMLHPNSIRAHLAILEEAGLVRCEIERSGRAGRPRQVFTADEEAQDAGRASSVRTAVAEILLTTLDAPGAQARAEAAAAIGSRWGDQIAGSTRSPADAMVTAFERAGIEVDWREDGAARVRRCPLSDLAQLRADVTCPIHAALLRAVLDRGAGLSQVSVELESSRHCLIRASAPVTPT